MVTKEETEKMLKVIEGDPSITEVLQSLVPAFYNIAIMGAMSQIMSNSLKEVFKDDKNINNKRNLPRKHETKRSSLQRKRRKVKNISRLVEQKVEGS